MKIIDISKHNGTIDWKRVKASGVEGIIIRAGYGSLTTQKDITFEANYKGVTEAGLHIGCYWYSYAENEVEAIREASVCMSVISGKKFDLPVFFDIEETKHVKMSKTKCSNIVSAFCTELEKQKYFVGVYSFDSFFNTNLNSSIQTRYALWVARVENVKPVYCKNYTIHQYSWKGSISGINGDVDLNECTVDYPTLITSKGFNGYQNSLYEVTATITETNKTKAYTLKSACEKMGMKVNIIEEK